jgi:hypothetical protein
MKNFYIKKEDKFCVIEKTSVSLPMLSIAQYLKEHESICFSSEFEENMAYLSQFGQWTKQKNVIIFSLEVLGFRMMTTPKTQIQETQHSLREIQENFQNIKKLNQAYKFICNETLKHKKVIEKIKVKSFKTYFDYEKQLHDFLMESKRKQLQLTQTEFNKSLVIDVLSLVSWKKNKIDILVKNWLGVLNEKGEPLMYEMIKPEVHSHLNKNLQTNLQVNKQTKEQKKELISLEELSLMAQKIMSLSTDQVLHQKLNELIEQKSDGKNNHQNK